MKALRVPTTQPANYKTLAGLLHATERVLRMRVERVGGVSRGMWLHNAEFVARDRFRDTSSIAALRDNFAVTRPADLKGGRACFGVPLPEREYAAGDVIPGLGRIVDLVLLPDGKQFCVDGMWVHERCLSVE